METKLEETGAQSVDSLGAGYSAQERSEAQLPLKVEKIVSRPTGVRSFNSKLSELAIDTHSSSEDEKPEAMPRPVYFSGQSSQILDEEQLPPNSAFQKVRKPEARKSPCMEVKEALKLVFATNKSETPQIILSKKTEVEVERRRSKVQESGQYMGSRERTVCSCFLF